jgi:hypothetical protein
VAEQRPGERPDEQEPNEEGGAVERAQPPLDARQLRQFQQFQQFQDFLRYQEAQQSGQLVPTQQGTPPVPPAPPSGGQLQVAAPPPPPTPRIRMPRFVKRALGTVLSALLFLAVLGIAGKLLYNHFFPSQDNNRPASENGGGTYHTNKILSTEPYEAVRKVYQQIAQGRPDLACEYFDDPTRQKFAIDLGGTDCAQAAGKVRVTNVNGYAESLPSYLSTQPQDTKITVNSCDFPISGGPALGVFTVTKVANGQWLITGHEWGPTTCLSPSTTGSPTG